METLPDELLESIVEECDFTSQKNIRLTSKRLERVASRFVFEDLHLILLPEYLEKWKNIAASQLARYAKGATIWTQHFFPMEFESFLNRIKERQWNLWLEATNRMDNPADESYRARLQPEFSASSFFLTEDDVHDVRTSLWPHMAHIQDQYVLWNRDCEISLMNTLCKLPNLQELKLGTSASVLEGKSGLPIWKKISKQTGLPPKEWLKDNYYPYPLAIERTPFSEEGFAAFVRCTELEQGAMAAAVHLLACGKSTSSRNHIVRLEGLFCSHRSFRSILEQLDPTFDDASWTKVLTGFGQLTALKIICRRGALQDERWDSFASRAEIEQILKHLQKVRRLEIRYDCGGQLGHLQLLVEDSIQRPLWPYIEHLTLKDIDIPAEALLSFLGRHSETLVELRLYGMSVGNVPKFLEQLPRVLSLKKISIWSLWHTGPGMPDYDGEEYEFEEFETKMVDYLLRKRPGLPDLARRPREKYEMIVHVAE